jgi:hypothetical protein
MDIEPKNAGVRELHPLRTRDLGPKPTCVDDRGSGKNLKFSGICPGIPVHPYGAVLVEEYPVPAAEKDLCAPLRRANDCVLGAYAPQPRRRFPVNVRIAFELCDHNIGRARLGGGHHCPQYKKRDSQRPKWSHAPPLPVRSFYSGHATLSMTRPLGRMAAAPWRRLLCDKHSRRKAAGSAFYRQGALAARRAAFERLRSDPFEGPATESLRLCRRIVTLHTCRSARTRT